MTNLPQIPIDLLNRAKAADEALRTWILSAYPTGTMLRWVDGKYKGRKCQILRAIIINEPDGSMSVGLRVRTQSLSGRDYINDKDQFHRTCWDAHHFFEAEEVHENRVSQEH